MNWSEYNDLNPWQERAMFHRSGPLFLLVSVLLFPLGFADEQRSLPCFPLKDVDETSEQYARRVQLPPTQAFSLGNDVQLELVLVPAAQFTMGSRAPIQPPETSDTGKWIVGLSAVLLLILVIATLVRALRRSARVKFSLRGLSLFVLVLAAALYGVVRWKAAEDAWKEYLPAKARYDGIKANEKPGHTVTISHPFYLGKFLITQEQYFQVMGVNPSLYKGNNNPVEWVSWNEALDFSRRISEKFNRKFRLPTEAEWEFACGAGGSTVYYCGDTVVDLSSVAWFGTETRTHPVGQKKPNSFGLYDMHGLLFEWCNDFYSETYYLKSPAIDPQGDDGIETYQHVLRGGCFASDPDDCRTVSRSGNGSERHDNTTGFRIAMSVE